MPQLGETVTEGTITRWLKAVGDTVAADEVLFEVSTDKVDSEVPSPAAGVLSEILVPEGETVDVGIKLATIGSAESTNGWLRRSTNGWLRRSAVGRRRTYARPGCSARTGACSATIGSGSGSGCTCLQRQRCRRGGAPGGPATAAATACSGAYRRRPWLRRQSALAGCSQAHQ